MLLSSLCKMRKKKLDANNIMKAFTDAISQEAQQRQAQTHVSNQSNAQTIEMVK